MRWGRCVAARQSEQMKPLSSCPFHLLVLACGGKKLSPGMHEKHDQRLDEIWQSCLPPEHSPNTEQSIVCCPREKIEAVAVRRSCGGEAQGRHSCGVPREFLSEQHQGANMRQTHQLVRHPVYMWHLISHVQSADSPDRPPWCLNPTSWLSDLLTAGVSHRGSHKGWSQLRDQPSTYCVKHGWKIRSNVTITSSFCLQKWAQNKTLGHPRKPLNFFQRITNQALLAGECMSSGSASHNTATTKPLLIQFTAI